jgi:ribulose-phosphate 3-epimerase
MTSLERLLSLRPAVSVGLLTADLLSLGSELSILERAGIGVAHVDVMDGVFTPVMTVGPPLVKALRTPLLKDVHLMIREPLATLADYAAAGADMITVHQESCTHIHRVLQALGTMSHATDPARGIVRGVALNPGTPLEAIEPLLPEMDMLLLLAVNPGWGGQKFIPATFDRMARARAMIAASGRQVLLGVDGGITRQNIAAVAAAGAELIVTGSAVFDGKAAAANAAFMLEAVGRGGRDAVSLGPG